MKRGRLPLTALRSFESAGRLLSFTEAAEELFVTQAAVSRQIRELEDSLGTRLFHRHHRRVSLTETGARLLGRLTESFDAIDEALREALTAVSRAPLVISVEPGFAACWLVSRLDGFRALQPEIDVEVLSDPRLIEFRTSRAALAIRYSVGAADWPRVEARLLVRSFGTPVLAPSLLATGPPLQRPEDLAQYTLLYEDGRQNWSAWMEAAGLPSHSMSRGPLYNDPALIVPAAVRGHGVALGDLALVSDDIAAGRLIAPFDLKVSFGGYWLVAPSLTALSPAAEAFVIWLSASLNIQNDTTAVPD
ncbi:LysR substrate-binding domain-containing protein [Acidisoma cladoniae]|jgi:LysR family glycine cleavage system transcriptional activator|uniref:LysR substrate-binding domain-containing protein n=1 Tax=Acidisoma cladoniae TaxID=3040935 RepID=UPI002550DD6F|nr:LysR substrate-binding domain-containing protein [Acidisoma sp. PAMC 29798]